MIQSSTLRPTSASRHAMQQEPALLAWRRPIRPEYIGGTVLRQTQRSWSSLSAAVTEVRGDQQMKIGLQADCTQLSIMLEEVGGRTAMRIGSVQPSAPDGRRLPMSLIPPRLGASGEAHGLRYMRHLVVQFDGETLAGMQDEAIDLQAALAPRAMFSCPRLLGLARLFAGECDSGEPSNLLYGDGLSVALLQGLTQLDRARPAQDEQGRLAPWQLRRAIECLEDKLAQNVPLQELATLTRLSVSYFCRAFKTSTGLPPHQWQLRARIEKAKEMLLDDRDPIAQIALAVGFADQAHMTRTFSRVVGTSPAAWQRPRRVARSFA
ncbi:helix-turn-helix transcriptional regulator [Roseomonas frigidaquae]|uniref:Helix-turn-helix transcriptional regulator n=1 Tax=Falsiroseomonas frigidaquae TaxID=487318 RepID=A0ABX1F465_9PROT|nr:AraC family transcriptional regulator [Falsiroseomonas frigidaquae]NKE47123.1 helix-turn-helix transcriptional regulator [Falsiroseomonas frigidaquae]